MDKEPNTLVKILEDIDGSDDRVLGSGHSLDELTIIRNDVLFKINAATSMINDMMTQVNGMTFKSDIPELEDIIKFLETGDITRQQTFSKIDRIFEIHRETIIVAG